MFDELLDRVGEISEQLGDGYAGRQLEVQALIDDAREELMQKFGVVPVWEKLELDAADAFANSNWLRASLSAVYKALQVSQLPDDEYWGGLRYTRPGIQITPRCLK